MASREKQQAKIGGKGGIKRGREGGRVQLEFYMLRDEGGRFRYYEESTFRSSFVCSGEGGGGKGGLQITPTHIL